MRADSPTSPEPSTARLAWADVDADRTADFPDLLSKVLDREIDGITIRGVFSRDEIARALTELAGCEQIPRPFGGLLGMPLGMSGTGPDERTAYHGDVDRARDAYRRAFDFDPHDRVAAVLSPLAGGLPMLAPDEDGRPYNPGHIRWWTPGGPGLQAHVGNEFRRHHEHGAMAHLLSITRVLHHLSYFVVLQRPDAGGALRVYDLVWEQDEGLEEWTDGQRPDGRFDDLPSTTIDLDDGDLVIFGGGWRWHRVDPLGPGRQRITYGGFAAPALDGSAMHFWA